LQREPATLKWRAIFRNPFGIISFRIIPANR
jgi:hypothetical protein